MHGVLNSVVDEVGDLVCRGVCLNGEKNFSIGVFQAGDGLGPEVITLFDHFLRVLFHLDKSLGNFWRRLDLRKINNFPGLCVVTPVGEPINADLF
jgi:hypothetical protein